MASLVVGAFVKYATGHAILGMIASATVSWILAPDAPQASKGGAKLEDTLIQSSTEGAYIKKVYGSERVAGNIVWTSGFNETVYEENENATYSYDATFAVVLCEGTITKINKIWADSVVIYNKRSDATSDEISESNKLDLSIYLGTEDQTVDPAIEAALGADDAPAFRGLAYIVFNHLELSRFGNRIPNITVEVQESETTYVKDILEDTLEICNISPDRYDTSEITDTVLGYVRTSQLTGRVFVEPLLIANTIIGFESDHKIKFKKYTGEVEENIVEDDLSCGEKKEEDKIIVTRKNINELPRRFYIRYTSEDRNYQYGVQATQRIKI